MNVSRSGYYKWKYRKNHPSIKELSRKENMILVNLIHNKHSSHGYRWINAYIRNKYGIKFTNNYVHRICKYLNIRSTGKHYNYKKPGEEKQKFNNLIWNGWKTIKEPMKVIVSDMTAFWANKNYYELTMYFDVWNKEIVGYGLSNRKGDTRTYYDGLKTVLSKIKEEQTITLHTDQGAVYSSYTYNNLLNKFNVQRSMSRAGTPTDNPVNESLNGWIKEELFLDFDLAHSNDVPNLIKLYITYYNNERPCFSLNYKTPIQYKIESGL